MKDEILNRRDFFKKSCARVLPILGALILTPTAVKAVASESQDYCPGSCTGLCTKIPL